MRLSMLSKVANLIASAPELIPDSEIDRRDGEGW
jgi:hypothetical protein